MSVRKVRDSLSNIDNAVINLDWALTLPTR
jgi:hypothetical protein